MPVLLAAASVSVPAAAVHYVIGEGRAPVGYVTHFVVILLASAIAGSAALALTTVGARREDGRVVVVGTAFSAMAALLAVHGLATEDVLVGEHEGVMALAGGAALPVAGAVLALSALPTLRSPLTVRWLVGLNAAILVAIAAFAAFAMLDPAAVPELPRPGSAVAIGAILAGAVFFGMLANRAARTYALTRRNADLAVLVGVLALAGALGLQLLSEAWSWGWWIGHAIEFAGIALVGLPVAYDIHRASQSRSLIGDLHGDELVAAEEAFLGSQVRALMLRLAEKDVYTEGHTRRVARRAVQVGEALGLPPATLRHLAIGGLLHDMGKLSVPDEIIRKPGPLDDDEYAVIRCHPGWGEELIAELGGFSAQVRRLILNHHERLDGKGYPRGLAREQIDLPTRVLTACDVYDALVSNRVYRAAWDPVRAMALLHEESGTAFDPLCVAALERVLEREAAADQPGWATGTSASIPASGVTSIAPSPLA
jgi:HD-GYP domain-containing protein (c-di-GMP phosphodiesterase class II)